MHEAELIIQMQRFMQHIILTHELRETQTTISHLQEAHAVQHARMSGYITGTMLHGESPANPALATLKHVNKILGFLGYPEFPISEETLRKLASREDGIQIRIPTITGAPRHRKKKKHQENT
jgi:hypothetical protein